MAGGKCKNDRPVEDLSITDTDIALRRFYKFARRLKSWKSKNSQNGDGKPQKTADNQNGIKTYI